VPCVGDCKAELVQTHKSFRVGSLLAFDPLFTLVKSQQSFLDSFYLTGLHSFPSTPLPGCLVALSSRP
jgi:hypothetical protein